MYDWHAHNITYLPHKAVAEVSKDKEPIGRECAEFNWFESQLMSDSNELRVTWFWLSIDLRFKWSGCQSMCASNDFGCLLIWTSSDSVVNWFEIQVIRLSIDLRFKWFGCQSIWDSNELVVNWFEIQMIFVVGWCEIQVIWLSNVLRFKWVGCQFEVQMTWLSIDARFKWFCALSDLRCKLRRETSFANELQSSKNEAFLRIFLQKQICNLKNKAFLRDFLQNWSFEAQKRSFSARLPSKMKLWRSKTKLLCEASFKIEALQLKNEAFLRDFLQKRSCAAQKRSIYFCETSFKIEALKLKNEAFARDFLQNWSFEDQKWSISARLPSKMKLWSPKTKLLCETSFKNEALKIKNEAFVRDFLQNESLKLKNEAFVRDFLQKWSFEDQKRSIFARLPSKMTSWPDTWPQNSNTF